MKNAAAKVRYAVGDFDADGKQDLAIGEPWATVAGQRAAGRVQIVTALGAGPKRRVVDLHLDAATATIDGPGNARAGMLFGYALTVGDFDGDGVDDLAVGAPGADGPAGFLDSGCIYVAHGGKLGLNFETSEQPYCPWRQPSGLSGRYVLSLPVGTASGAATGVALATGDFDGDGGDDLAIGAAGWRPVGGTEGTDPHRSGLLLLVPFAAGGPEAGRRLQAFSPYASQASAIIPVQPLATLERRAAGLVGASLAVGNFNGDRFDDLAIGAPGGNRGAVLLALGRTDGLSPYRHSHYGSDAVGRHRLPESGGTLPMPLVAPSSRAGRSLAAADFDGDGFDDLAVGAPGQSVADLGAVGAVFLLQGSRAGLDTTRHRSALHSAADPAYRIFDKAGDGSAVGWSMAAGDLDGDGLADLAVGSPGWPEPGRRMGAVEVRFGHRSLALPVPMIGLELPGGPVGEKRQLLRRGFFSAGRLPGLPVPGDAIGASVAHGHLGLDGRAELFIAAPGVRVLNPSAPGNRPPSEGLGTMLLDGTTFVVAGHSSGPRHGPRRLLYDMVTAQAFWRFDALQDQPAGVRMAAEGLKQRVADQVGRQRESIQEDADGLNLRRLRARNIRIGSYDRRAADDRLAYDIKFDLCLVKSFCCFDVDVNTEMTFACDGGDLVGFANLESPRIRGSDLCMDQMEKRFGLALLTTFIRGRIAESRPARIITRENMGQVGGVQLTCQAVRLLPDLSLEIDIGF